MKANKLKNFIQDLYLDQTGQSVQFESRTKNSQLNQIVSSLMSEEEAMRVRDSLKRILPPCANVKVCESHQVEGQFRAVIFNPKEILSVYAQRMAGLLNKHHPFPMEIFQPCLQEDYVWTVLDGESMTIGYKAEVSFGYVSLDSEDSSEQIQKDALYGYNQLLTSTYPGFKIGSISHRHGDEFHLDTFTYSNFKDLMAKNQVPSLRDIGIKFFRDNPQYYTDKVFTALPKDITEDMKDIPVSSLAV